MFILFDKDDQLLLNLQRKSIEHEHNASSVVAAKKSIVDIYDRGTNLDPYLEIINNNVRKGNLIGSIPENFLIPYPIKQWAFQINYSTYDCDEMPVVPHYDTPEYVCVCLLEDFPEGFGGELCTELGHKITLTKAGECVVINGSKVKHWVTSNRNPDIVRKTLVISLVDNRKIDIKLDYLGYPRQDVIKDWLEWNIVHKTKTSNEMVKMLLSKL